jgi:hypothetical protein
VFGFAVGAPCVARAKASSIVDVELDATIGILDHGDDILCVPVSPARPKQKRRLPEGKRRSV